MAKFGYKIRNKDGIYFVTFAVVEWIDVFTRKDYQEILIDSLKFCQKEKGLIIYAWCLMTNHIHLIISAKESNLSDILRDFKKFTSKKLVKSILNNPAKSRKKWMINIFRKLGTGNIRNEQYQFWRQDNHPKELFSEKFINRKLDYTHNNPVEAGLVEKAEDYLLSSARNYFLQQNGLIEIEYL